MAEVEIYVQCGTTHTRAMRVRRDERGILVQGMHEWAGVSALGSAFEETLFGQLAEWLQNAPHAPIFLNGMAGSTLGWHPAPYVECPADLAAIAAAAVNSNARGRRIAIFPGVKGRNAFGEPDVMRGEETEIFGLLAIRGRASSPRLICIPGTHTKWVRVRGDSIEALHTTVTGELFSLLVRHSVLARGANPEELDDIPYSNGLQEGLGARGTRMLHSLFAARVQQVLGGGTANDAASYLSGLLIGADVAGMKAIAPAWFESESTVEVIGTAGLAPRYAGALIFAGCKSAAFDAGAAARSGFAALAAALPP